MGAVVRAISTSDAVTMISSKKLIDTEERDEMVFVQFKCCAFPISLLEITLSILLANLDEEGGGQHLVLREIWGGERMWCVEEILGSLYPLHFTNTECEL